MHLSKRWMKFLVGGAMAATLTFTAASAMYAGETTASSLNLRATPGGTVIGSLARGTKVVVLDNTTDWYQVAVNGQTAYISGSYVEFVADDLDFPLGLGVVNCSSSLRFRSAPSTESEVLGSLVNGQKISLIGIDHQGWYKADVNGKQGYVSADYVSITGGQQLDKTAVMGATTNVDASSAVRQQVLNYAAQFLGTPYVYGGSTPTGFDCSGFTSYVYKNTVTPIARTSSDQRSTTKNISKSDLLPGDLVFFGSGGSVSHVGIYVGNGQFIHSPHTGSVVKYDSLDSGTYSKRFICGGRVIND